MDTSTVNSPAEQRQKNRKIIEENILIYEKMCELFGLTGQEMLLLENGISIERMLRVATDRKFQDKKERRAREKNLSTDLAKEYCRVTKINDGRTSSIISSAPRDSIMAILKSIVGDTDKASNFGKRAGFSAFFKSNLDEILYQRGRNQIRNRSVSEAFTLSQGASLEARFRSIMDKHLGVATVVGTLKNIISSQVKNQYKPAFIYKPGRNNEKWTPMERDLALLERKVFPGPLKAIVKKIPSLNPSEQLSALTTVVEASLVLKPQITHKMMLPWCMWRNLKKHCEATGKNFEELTSYSGRQSFLAFNLAAAATVMTVGKGIIGDPEIWEDEDDKRQTLLMACFGLAYEDIGIVESMVGRPLKRRYQMKINNFGPSDGGKVVSCAIGFTHWADFGNRLPFTQSGSGASKQISNSGVFNIERGCTTNIERALELLNKHSNDAQEPLSVLVSKVREQMQEFQKNKEKIREFVGGSMYRMDDPERQNPIKYQRGGTSFFFEFTPTDIKRSGERKKRTAEPMVVEAGTSFVPMTMPPISAPTSITPMAVSERGRDRKARRKDEIEKAEKERSRSRSNTRRVAEVAEGPTSMPMLEDTMASDDEDV
uniref:Nucleoprotein n=1 Tax=Cane toad influenza-like virus TaxID=2777031 RepID=A0A866W070_9ORTO|nr:nucleoprotein [Cane toad influenza-like virus]